MSRMDKRIALYALAISTAAIVYSAPAAAQATRTWVSGVGDDANPCSRTAPCKTFAGAISKTAAGGEINCLDSGGFGGVTITKSISIICDGVEGGVLVSGTNGIVVNAGANDVVVLSGLDIEGVGTGINGVRFIAGGSLTIQNSTISDFRGANSNGISFQPSGVSQLYVTNVTIANNGNGPNGSGIFVQPVGINGTANVFLRDVRVQRNSGNALRVDTTGTVGTTLPGMTMMIEDSQFTSSTNGINVLHPASTINISMMIVDSTIANNSGTGVLADGAGINLRMSGNTIFANAAGVVPQNGAAIVSFVDNVLNLNPAFGVPNNGAFNGTAAKQ